MEQQLERKISLLQEILNNEGIGVMRVNYLLLTPEEALIFLEAAFALNTDLAILGTTLWDRDKKGNYFESPDIFNFDKIQRDNDFVEYSYRETRLYIESLVGDPTIDRLVIEFESDKTRQRRLEQFTKNSPSNSSKSHHPNPFSPINDIVTSWE